jgi:hypothetical protein
MEAIVAVYPVLFWIDTIEPTAVLEEGGSL